MAEKEPTKEEMEKLAEMEKAADELLQTVFIPAFRTKLAAEGLTLQDEEVGPALEIATKLQLLGATTREKEASSQLGEFLKAASAALDEVPVEEAPKETDTEKAAEELLKSPELVEAVKTLLGS